MMNWNDLVELEKWAKKNRKWYIKLWEDYVSIFLFISVPLSILILIGILIGKYLL